MRLDTAARLCYAREQPETAQLALRGLKMKSDGREPTDVYQLMLDSDRRSLSNIMYRQLEEHSIEPLLRIPNLIGMAAEWKLTMLEKRLALLVQASS